MSDAATPDGESAGKPRRPRVMPDVLRALAGDILDGRYPAGSLLPRENDLGAEYGVSRTVIREALKVLAAKGLVRGRPRIGTVVCESDEWNIIDPQVMEWHSPTALDHRLLDAIFETRRAIEPLVAELAATRASLQEVANIETAWRGMADAGADVDGFLRSDITFHRTLYAASHNPVFRQIGNLIDAALNMALETTAAHSPDDRAQAVHLHLALVEALRLRDGAGARLAAERIIERACSEIAAVRRLTDI